MQAALLREPVLQYPDYTKPFVLTTDTSGFAVGAILSQGKIGQDKPIAPINSLFINSSSAPYSFTPPPFGVIRPSTTTDVYRCHNPNAFEWSATTPDAPPSH